MLIEASTPLLAKGNVQATQAFTFNASAHAFKILSDGLYSNKILAVIRELSCNAVDAHRMVGTPDMPIVVRLPHSLDPTFYVQDYGPGLSDDDVMHLYTTYFQSTKSQSNDQIGGFGLGSKSPFAYTDTFTVESCFGGKLRSYAAYIDTNGYPAISRLAETDAPADWSHGLRVSMPVRKQDFSRFADEARALFRFFPVIPKVIGHGGLSITPISYITKTPLFGLPDRNGYYRSSCQVVMGGVPYPLDVDSLGDPSHDLTTGTATLSAYYHQLLRELAGQGLTLFFNVGDLPVTPSRESLSLTPAALVTLRTRVTAVVHHFMNEVVSAVRSMPVTAEGFYDVYDKYIKFYGAFYPFQLGPCVAHYMNESKVPDSDVIAKRLNTLIEGRFVLTLAYRDTDKMPPLRTVWWNARNSKMASSEGRWERITVPFHAKTSFLVEDGSPKFKDRVREHLRNSPNVEILMLDGVKALPGQVDAARKHFATLPFAFNEMKVSDLPPPPTRKARIASGTLVQRKPRDQRPMQWFDTSICIGYAGSRALALQGSAGVYGDIPPGSRVFMVRYTGWGKHFVHYDADSNFYGRGTQTDDPRFALEIMHQAGVLPPKIAVITRTDAKRLKFETDGWLPLAQWVRAELVKKSLNTGKYIGQPKDVLHSTAGSLRRLVWYAATYPAVWSCFDINTDLKATVDGIIAECGKGSLPDKQRAAVLSLASDYNIKPDDSLTMTSLTTACDQIQHEKHPELGFIRALDEFGHTKADVLEDLLNILIPKDTIKLQAVA